MSRRILRPLVYALLTVQLLLSLPVAVTWAAKTSAHTIETKSAPCDAMNMPGGHQPKHCPCCPDGATGELECQIACATGVAALPLANDFLPIAVAVPTTEPVPVNFLPLADPPLKPPPIA